MKTQFKISQVSGFGRNIFKVRGKVSSIVKGLCTLAETNLKLRKALFEVVGNLIATSENPTRAQKEFNSEVGLKIQDYEAFCKSMEEKVKQAMEKAQAQESETPKEE